MIRTEVSGTCKVFRNDSKTADGREFTRYQASLSKRLTIGGWENAYINLQFRKGVELDNKADIEIISGWLTFDKYNNKDGKPVTTYKIFVNEFEVMGGADEPRATKAEAPDYQMAFNASADDIPF